MNPAKALFYCAAATLKLLSTNNYCSGFLNSFSNAFSAFSLKPTAPPVFPILPSKHYNNHRFCFCFLQLDYPGIKFAFSCMAPASLIFASAVQQMQHRKF